MRPIQSIATLFGRYVGTVVGPFYDERGKPTEELARVAQQVAIADKIKQKLKEDEKRFPSCSSRWSAQQGGEVRFNLSVSKLSE